MMDEAAQSRPQGFDLIEALPETGYMQVFRELCTESLGNEYRLEFARMAAKALGVKRVTKTRLSELESLLATAVRRKVFLTRRETRTNGFGRAREIDMYQDAHLDRFVVRAILELDGVVKTEDVAAVVAGYLGFRQITLDQLQQINVGADRCLRAGTLKREGGELVVVAPPESSSGVPPIAGAQGGSEKRSAPSESDANEKRSVGDQSCSSTWTERDQEDWERSCMEEAEERDRGGIKFDDVNWHSGGDFPADLPDVAGATHIGLFLEWAILRNHLSASFSADIDSTVDSLRCRDVTGVNLLLSHADGKLTADLLSEEAQEFAFEYYDKTHRYFEDYADGVGDLPTVYHAENSPENLAFVLRLLDAAFDDWCLERQRSSESDVSDDSPRSSEET